MNASNTVVAAPIGDASGPRIPVAVKLAYTAFAAILIPVYLVYYGPTNFLYFCDQAVLLTLAGLWLESPLLISLCAVGILAPQILWIVDFLGHALGMPLTGMTDYMFDAGKPLHLRALSSFHGWLPVLLVFLLTRLGYDGRALGLWTAMAGATLLVCFFLMPPPNPDAGLTPVNINYVWGTSDAVAQSLVPPVVWLLGLLVGLPLLFFAPTHLALSRLLPPAPPRRPAPEPATPSSF